MIICGCGGLKIKFSPQIIVASTFLGPYKRVGVLNFFKLKVIIRPSFLALSRFTVNCIAIIIIALFIRVVLQTQRTIAALNLFLSALGIDAKDFIRIGTKLLAAIGC